MGAAVLALTACMPDSPDDPPDCEVNGSTGHCAVGLQFAEQVGKPMASIRYQRQGETFFRQTPMQNCREISPAGICHVYANTGPAPLSITMVLEHS